jgi:hypothetical protein
VSLEKSPTQQEFPGRPATLSTSRSPRVTRNPLLVHVFELIIEARAAAGWGRLRSLNDTSEARRGQAAANRAILEALKDRDAELARRLLRAHFRQHGRKRSLSPGVTLEKSVRSEVDTYPGIT